MQVLVGVLDGKVIATWDDPCREITFDPQNAYTVGTALSRAALEAHRGHASPGDTAFIAGELAEVKKLVSDTERMALIMTVATIVRTLIDQKRNAGYIAQHCVDAILRETAR